MHMLNWQVVNRSGESAPINLSHMSWSNPLLFSQSTTSSTDQSAGFTSAFFASASSCTLGFPSADEVKLLCLEFSGDGNCDLAVPLADGFSEISSFESGVTGLPAGAGE